MTVLPTNPGYVTIDEYLRLEADAVEKHEYFEGRIVAMAGGTEEHSLIISNLIREIGNRLKGKPCRVYDSNLRVRIPRSTLYTYPDLSIVCGESQFDPKDRKRTTVINPRVLIEVQSESSEGIDGTRKFQQYLTLDSLEEYVLVSQASAFVQTFFRRGDGTWLMTPSPGLDAVLKLQSLDVELALSEVYTGVRFPPEPVGPQAF